MTRFAFVIHPMNKYDVARKYPFARYLPESVVEWGLRRIRPQVVSKIEGIVSKTGAVTEGWFIGCPLTPRQIIERLPEDEVYQQIAECAAVAAREGAELIGLGAFTSVVGDGGISIQKLSPIPVTTGNSYTVATAIQGTLKACALLDMDVSASTLAVVGATGSIGRTCAKILANSFARVILIGRDQDRTELVATGIPGSEASVNLRDIAQADAVVTVTSAGKDLIVPEYLKPGAVVCDVARPRDVSRRVARERPDVLVIEGGVINVPGDVRFNFDFGFPGNTAFACMSETIMLALEGDPSLFNFTLGKDVSVEQVEQISALADKHGFSLADFRAFEEVVDPQAFARARKARVTGPTVARAL
jgi:fatty aldehyde-generating acyl-ACP reductase